MSLKTQLSRKSQTRFSPTTGCRRIMMGESRFFRCIQPCGDHERRQDIVEELRKHYRVTDVIDYSRLEDEGCCLEGTGSLVFDHLNKIAYVSLSNRSNPKMIQRFADDFSYEPVIFTSIGPNGEPIYHTNVMMCIGTAFAMVGLEMIRKQSRAATGASALGEDRKGDRGVIGRSDREFRRQCH